MAAAPLIDAEMLATELASAAPPVLLDVRWRLDRPDGRPAYLDGHIPGAVFVDLDTELAHITTPDRGRHPLPPVEQLEASARRWGLAAGGAVVVYDDWMSMAASRAWWLLRFAGVEDVRVLDGGLGAWKAAGRPLDSGDVTPAPGDVRLTYGHLPVIDIDEAAAFDGLLIDMRAGERYRGEVEPMDPIAGHIPGAVNVPAAGSVDADGRFLGAAALRERFAVAGVRDGEAIATYCGSGVTAAHGALALAIAGFAPAVYPGSWSEWSNRPGMPVATAPASA